jgi:uncharacterized protein with NAD-binding domain and iron-sulfur cluster
MVGRLCQLVFRKSEADEPAKDLAVKGVTSSSSPEHYYQIVISGSRNLLPIRSEKLGSLIHQDLAGVFPAAGKSKLLRCKAVTDPHSVFSVTPGSWRDRPECRTSIENLWLAGDWTRTGWPSTMESAVRSGLLAAKQVLKGP